MKKSVKIILPVAVLCAVLAGGYVFYQGLAQQKAAEAQTERQSLSLQEAISLNNLNAVEFIIKNGANIEAPINQGDDGRYFTALGWALFSNRPEIARYLIEQGADVTAQIPLGSSLLYWALAHQMNNVALQLIDKGAELSAADGYNPAQHADIIGLTQVVEKLKEKGLTPDSPGSEDLD